MHKLRATDRDAPDSPTASREWAHSLDEASSRHWGNAAMHPWSVTRNVTTQRGCAAPVCSRAVGHEPPVMAEVTVSGLLHQPHELFPADAD